MCGEQKRQNWVMKTAIPELIIVVQILCLASLQNGQAVSPPPDGGYPGDSTAEGSSALQNLTTGLANTGLGWHGLFTDSSGNYNTAVGAGALVLNNADANTATGAAALLLNTSGTENTANGVAALLHNDSGIQNTAIGAFALNQNTTGNSNTAVGVNALLEDTEGSPNSAFGWSALMSNSTGGYNTALGYAALLSNTTGGFNTAVGDGALFSNIDGGLNTAIGTDAGYNITGSGNIDIGNDVTGVAGESNTIRIGDNLPGNQGESACYVGGIYGQFAATSQVYINADGKLGAVASSQRFKDDIKPMDKASEAILALKPVTFRYKKEIDPGGTPQFGLVAEEVEKVNSDLIVRDKHGKPYSVRYDQVNAMLLNEFLKEHKTVQQLMSVVEKQEALVAEQHKQIEVLTAGLQKVSAQLELSKAAPQTVLNNP
jgi:trimeric autotransporter adhesin